LNRDQQGTEGEKRNYRTHGRSDILLQSLCNVR
jgi:hypothetical protein